MLSSAVLCLLLRYILATHVKEAAAATAIKPAKTQFGTEICSTA